MLSHQDILKFIKDKQAPRRNFPTLQEAIEEADICLQLIAKRAAKYGEAWKDTRMTSLVDYVLMKYHRVNTMASDPTTNREKLESDLRDMINYGYFCLIKLQEETKNTPDLDLSILNYAIASLAFSNGTCPFCNENFTYEEDDRQILDIGKVKQHLIDNPSEQIMWSSSASQIMGRRNDDEQQKT